MSSRRLDAGHDVIGRPPWGIATAVAAFLGGMVMAIVAGSIAVSAGAGTTDAVTNTASFFGEWTGFVGVPIWLSRTRGTRRLATDFGFRFGGPADVGLGLVAGLGTYGLVAAYSAILSQFDHANLGHEAQQLSARSEGIGFLAFAFCAAIGAPVAEELFFRGLTQPALQRRLGNLGGLLATAVIFGFVHLGANPVEAIPPLIFVGLVVGTLAHRTGRLGPGIVAHVMFNGITVAALAAAR